MPARRPNLETGTRLPWDRNQRNPLGRPASLPPPGAFPNAAAILLAATAFLVSIGRAASPAPELVDVRRIWDQAPHNAFTDLACHQGRWLCVFREGASHVSPDGALRVLQSTNGLDWAPSAVLRSATADLRDAKITRTPNGDWMLSGAGAFHPPSPAKHQSYAWFSKDAVTWSDPVPIGHPDLWLWRTTWHKGTAWSIGYGTAGDEFVRLYRSVDGRHFETVIPRLVDREYPNEHALVFLPDDTALCLLRRDGRPGHALLGRSPPPYTTWTWNDTGIRFGGPQALRLPDGRVIAAGRVHRDGSTPRTALAWIDPAHLTLETCFTLPSGGDTSYPGLVFHEGLLWISYYSSHEGRTSIYLARLRLARQ